MSLLPITSIIKPKTALNDHNWCYAGVRALPNANVENVHDKWQAITILPKYEDNVAINIDDVNFENQLYDLHYELNHFTDHEYIYFEVHFQTRDIAYQKLWNAFITSAISKFGSLYSLRGHKYPNQPANITQAIQHSSRINYPNVFNSSVEQDRLIKVINQTYDDLHTAIIDFYKAHLKFIRANSLITNYNIYKLKDC
jgi:hypothetical protein